MDIVSNENNLAPLMERIANYAAQDANKNGEILIASGWIQSEYFKRLFPETVVAGLVERKIKLRVLLRVGTPTDLKISDIGLFRFIAAIKTKGVNVSLRYSSHHHAKLYVVGKTYAMLGSFNLTSGGFGDEGREGRNPEAGVATLAKGEVNAAITRFEEMWNKASELADALVGFVANESDDAGFWLIGVRELPAGMFVQTRVGGRIVLGKVERSLRYRSDFFDAEREAIMANPFIFERFGMPKPSGEPGAINPAALNGIASVGNVEAQLEIGRVKAIRSIERLHDGSLRFEASSLPPPVGGEVHAADPTLFGAMFDPAACAKPYAELRDNRGIAVSFSPEPMLAMHSAVLGATGSGKSHFMKRYLSNFLVPYNEASWKGRIVIVDTHGEYGEFLSDAGLPFAKLDLGPGEKINFDTPLVESIDDFTELFELKPDRKLKKRITEALADPKKLDKDSFIKILREAASDDARLDVMKYVATVIEAGDEDVPEEYAKDFKKAREKIDQVKLVFDLKRRATTIDNVRKDLADKILKSYGYGTAETPIEKVISAIERNGIRFERLDFLAQLKKPGLYLLDLRQTSDRDIRQAVVGELMGQVFDEAKRAGKLNALFIVDEAQNYAPQGEGKSIPSKRAMRVIASEGRKFRVGLMVATQRPAYVDKDILAQCNSQAIFRLINNLDIAQVENTVEGISKVDLEQLPNFVAGEALFTGVAMTMPVRVRVQ
jgi:DNA helicase HerA-like ATPase